MALNFNNLQAYTDDHKMPLIKKSILGGRTLQYINVQPDIKSAAQINLIDSDLNIQSGACGWNAQGTTNLSQRKLEVVPLKINEAICLDDLEKYYTQVLMRPGSYNEEIPFEEIFAAEKAGKVNKAIDEMIWKGDTSGSTSTYLDEVDGFIKLAQTEVALVIDGNPTGMTNIDATNVIAAVEGVEALLPADILTSEDKVIFVGYDVYRVYAQALRAANLFHYDGNENATQYEMFIPGTDVKLIAVAGLNGTKAIFGGRMANFYFGTDLLNDAEDFDIFYDRNDDEVRFRAKWKMGVQFAVPEHIVYFELDPSTGTGT